MRRIKCEVHNGVLQCYENANGVKRTVEQTKQLATYWFTLHKRAFVSGSWILDTESEWYFDWCNSLPAMDCDCRKHWQELCELHTPDFSSADAFFRWGVDRHNDVNRKLGKPVMAMDEARAIYQQGCASYATTQDSIAT